MSTTDKLRLMLDERGIAHSDHYLSTTGRDKHGTLHLASESMADGSLVVDMLTPKQAIAATLENNRVTEDSIDKGLREFQLAHEELAHIGPDELKDLAYALHDDIPLGYEASMRLGQGLLCVALDSETTSDEMILLPCPMCGAEWPAVQVRWIGFTHTHNGAFSAGYRGECCDCGLTTRAFNNEDEAIKAWNVRATNNCLN